MKPEQKTAAADPAPSSAPSLDAFRLDRAPLWEAIAGMLVVGVLYAFLPEKLSIGPGWLLLVVEAVFLVPLILTVMTRSGLLHKAIRPLIFTLLALLTLAVASGIILLIITLPSDKLGVTLLRAAVLLWCANIVVFGLWYWQLDGGGPVKRFLSNHQAADFMFPQQAQTATTGNKTDWAPRFVDYLFLSFTGATALSPADTFPLSRPAKALMMVEAVLSMTIVVLLAGRAVNIVGG